MGIQRCSIPGQLLGECTAGKHVRPRGERLSGSGGGGHRYGRRPRGPAHKGRGWRLPAQPRAAGREPDPGQRGDGSREDPGTPSGPRASPDRRWRGEGGWRRFSLTVGIDLGIEALAAAPVVAQQGHVFPHRCQSGPKDGNPRTVRCNHQSEVWGGCRLPETTGFASGTFANFPVAQAQR